MLTSYMTVGKSLLSNTSTHLDTFLAPCLCFICSFSCTNQSGAFCLPAKLIIERVFLINQLSKQANNGYNQLYRSSSKQRYFSQRCYYDKCIQLLTKIVTSEPLQEN